MNEDVPASRRTTRSSLRQLVLAAAATAALTTLSLIRTRTPREALGEQPDEHGRRKADDVEVVAVDPLDECRAEALELA